MPVSDVTSATSCARLYRRCDRPFFWRPRRRATVAYLHIGGFAFNSDSLLAGFWAARARHVGGELWCAGRLLVRSLEHSAALRKIRGIYAGRSNLDSLGTRDPANSRRTERRERVKNPIHQMQCPVLTALRVRDGKLRFVCDQEWRLPGR